MDVRPISVHKGVDGVVYVGGELDIASRDEFLSLLRERLPGCGDVVLDLSDLSFMDVTGVRTLVTLAKRVWPDRLILRNPSSPVASILETFQLDGRLGMRIDSDPKASDRADGSIARDTRVPR